jgi:lysophospholipase L1-like esterase
MKTKLSKSRLLLLRLGLLFLSSIFSLFLAEGLLRLFHPIPQQYIRLPVGLIEDDDTRGWRSAANFEGVMRYEGDGMSIHTDPHGLRTHPKAATEGEFNMLFLGDSFTFGQGVIGEETYAAVVEQEINAASPEVHARSLNAGVTAYSVAQYAPTLTDLYPFYKPQVVITCLYVENDMTLAWSPPEERWMEFDRPRFGRTGGKLYFRSHLYRLLKHRLLDPIKPDGARLFLRVYNKTDDFRQPLKRHVNEELEKLAATCRDHGVFLVLTIIPCNYQMDTEAWEKLLQTAQVDGKDYDIMQPNRFIMEWAKQNGVPCLDVAEVLNKDAQPKRFFIPNDRHFNTEGHRVAGEAIAQWLTQLSESK